MLIICNQAHNRINRGFTYARSTIGELSRVPCSVVQWTEPHGISLPLYDGELYLSENYNLSPLVLIPLLVYNNYGSARLLWNWMYTLYILCYLIATESDHPDMDGCRRLPSQWWTTWTDWLIYGVRVVDLTLLSNQFLYPMHRPALWNAPERLVFLGTGSYYTRSHLRLRLHVVKCVKAMAFTCQTNRANIVDRYLGVRCAFKPTST